MWKNTAEPDRPQMTIWHLRIACWITKATDKRSEYVKLIPFPLQRWLREDASMLSYTYVACLVIYLWEIRGKSETFSLYNAFGTQNLKIRTQTRRN